MDPFYSQELIPALNRGLITSVMLIVPSAIFGLLGGVVIGTLRVFGNAPVRRLFNIYASVFRGVPLMVQLFILYYGLPNIGIYLDAYGAAVIGFILCSSAYNSEYIRGALQAIKSGQLKAGAALGMSKVQTIVWIVIPQAFRKALPGCGNEVIYLIKYSSLAYIVSCIELTGEARAIASQTFRFTEAFTVVACYYLILVTIASYILKRVEKRLEIPGFGIVK
ncbi:amino acid ABC transporter permease [Desulfotalea psychrophila]|uniref:Probable glutamine ABC transporter, permease protein n=1 Tax=Desulfotalea psychrophila (strain LSv54 / DSM 12343) TaxID=177439 RepID=Q6APG7_DESPS|nr:amino acid ABC transporter permease [Desulfotalea psychrophila]CAG35757.1 probable glutamine ABC transporter, permease protein [Desulfotalea psychrophila LSv54]